MPQCKLPKCLEKAKLLQTKPAVNRALEWTQRVAELDKPLSQEESAHGFASIKPNTVVGPILYLSMLHLDENSGHALWTHMPSGSTRARILCKIAGSPRIATIQKTTQEQLKTISAEGYLQLSQSQM